MDFWLADELARRFRRDGIGTTGWRLLKYLGHVGVRGAGADVLRYVVGQRSLDRNQDEFDVQRGVFTSAREPVWKLEIRSRHRPFALHYEAVRPRLLKQAFAAMDGISSGSTFLDLGCGKGRALIMAAEAGFGRVAGVELSEKLVTEAKLNLERLGIEHASVRHGDATDVIFDIPDLTLFMYNPFDGEVMSKVVSNLKVAPQPPAYIIYCNPVCAGLLGTMSEYQLILDEPQVMVWRCRRALA